MEQGKAVVVDLGFIVDRSVSLTSKDVQAQYNYIKFLARNFLLSLEWSHFGIITAADSAEVAITFGFYDNVANFESGVDMLSTSTGGKLRFDLALAAAVNNLFTASSGMRSGKAR